MTGRNVPAVRVMVVDDHAVVAEGIQTLLDTFDAITVVGIALSGRDVVARCSESQPDVVLMDLSMPDVDGVAATAALLHSMPTVRVIALTGFLEEPLVRGVIDAGATGYLLKSVSGDDLAAAVIAASAGQSSLSTDALGLLTSDRDEGVGFRLTERGDVLGGVVAGMTNKQIA